MLWQELVKGMRSTAGCFTACTGPVNQMGRCSRLIMVRLRSFFSFGIMPTPLSLASSPSHFQWL